MSGTIKMEYSVANLERLGKKEFDRQHEAFISHLEEMDRVINERKWHRFTEGLGLPMVDEAK